MQEQKKTLHELKAEAYDCACQVQAWQAKLNTATQLINNYQEAPKMEAVPGGQNNNKNKGNR